jgi:microcystin-dependent protein
MELESRDYISIILTCTIIYLLYENLCNKNNIENMSNTDDNKITEEINKIYKADVQSIRNLAEISEKLQKGTLSIPGNLSVEGTMSVEGKFNYLPTGSIIAFNGIIAPKGWTVCDGTNGTPDLRGRFIRMWNDTGFKQTDTWHGGATRYTVKCKRTSKNKDTLSGKQRGSDQGYIFKHYFGDMAGTDVTLLSTAEMPAHNHSLSTNGNHNHNVNTRDHGTGTACHSCSGSYVKVGDGSRTTNTTGNHTHTVANTGSGAGHGISNPYHVLTYIMKL